MRKAKVIRASYPHSTPMHFQDVTLPALTLYDRERLYQAQLVMEQAELETVIEALNLPSDVEEGRATKEKFEHLEKQYTELCEKYDRNLRITEDLMIEFIAYKKLATRTVCQKFLRFIKRAFRS